MSELRVAAAALLLTALFASPLLVHALDGGRAPVSIESLAKHERPKSRNLELTGALRTDAALSVVQQKNAVQTWAKYRFGVLPAGHRPGDALPLVLETPQLPDAEIAALAQGGTFRCTLRDVLWEGLPHEDRAFFADRLHAQVTGDTLLCELGAPDPRREVQRFLMIFASAVLTLAIAYLGARRFIRAGE